MKWFNKRAAPSESVRSDEWNERRSYRPMEVARSNDGTLDRYLDDSWDDATKLQWHAGVLKADTGFAVTFYQPSSGRGDSVDWNAFGLVAPEGKSALASIRVNDFWMFAVGVRWGIEWAKTQTPSEE